MSKLNINRIAQLVGYGTLNETADYDFGGVEPRTHKVPFQPSKSGQANLPVRMVNKQGDNPLEEEGICEPDPRFTDMDDDYIRTMMDMMRTTPAMASSEANLQWLAAANAELARRETFAQASSQAEQDVEQEAGDMAAQAIVAPTPDQVSAPVCDVMIDRVGFPEHMTVIQDGRFFVTAKCNATGATETFPRDEWDSMVLDNDSMYDNVRVGDRLPQVNTPEDDMVVLGIGEDEDMDAGDESLEEAPWDVDTNKECDDVEQHMDDQEPNTSMMSVNHKVRDIEEGVMDEIRQHINPETLSKAHAVLTKAGISDTAIIARKVNMKPSGFTKLAHILTGEPMADADAEEFCMTILHKLADALEGGREFNESVKLDEFEGMGGDQRFGYTTDSLGNVNITDARTGASLYLQGQDAQELLGTLAIHGATPESVQAILSQYEHVLDDQVDDDGMAIGLDIPDSSDIDTFGF
jgi:hypothetical protein